MPYRSRHAALALILMLVGVPVEASSPWGWLQKLSGPGNFDRRATGFDVPWWVYPRCNEKQSPDKRFGASLDDRFIAPSFTWSQYKADADERFDQVNLDTFTVLVYLHPAALWHRDQLCSVKTPHPPSPLDALDIGVGVAWYHFSGDGTRSSGTSSNGAPVTANGAFTRTGVPLRFKLTPSELFSRSLHGHKTTRKVLAMFSYNFALNFGLGSFDQSNFNFKGSGVYHASDGVLKSHEFLVDFTTLAFR